jgi:hypothetical protein
MSILRLLLGLVTWTSTGNITTPASGNSDSAAQETTPVSGDTYHFTIGATDAMVPINEVKSEVHTGSSLRFALDGKTQSSSSQDEDVIMGEAYKKRKWADEKDARISQNAVTLRQDEQVYFEPLLWEHQPFHHPPPEESLTALPN